MARNWKRSLFYIRLDGKKFNWRLFGLIYAVASLTAILVLVILLFNVGNSNVGPTDITVTTITIPEETTTTEPEEPADTTTTTTTEPEELADTTTTTTTPPTTTTTTEPEEPVDTTTPSTTTTTIPATTTTTLVPTPTLGVTLDADPPSGGWPLIGVGFIVTLSGTASGTASYEVDCGTGFKFGGYTESNSVHTDALCNYLNAGIYTITITVTREGITESAQTTITVSD